MREYFRPYNKIIDITDAAQHVVLLTDTSGGTMPCNYITVGAVSSGGVAAGDAMFQVVPSGVNTMFGASHLVGGIWQSNSSGSDQSTSGALSGRDRGPSGYPNASVRASNSTSGVLGMLGSVASDTLIFSLAPFDAARAVIITQDHPLIARYVITYGQVNEANSRADISKPVGEQTWTGRSYP